MWGWQNPNQPSDHGAGTSSSTSGHPGVVVPGGPTAQQHHPGQPQQGQELSDMLQMLDQTSGTTSFEDLNIHMFNTPFE